MNGKVLIFLLLPTLSFAQGFAGLGTATEDFATPEQPAEFTFPADHGPHADYRIEWWYLCLLYTSPSPRD